MIPGQLFAVVVTILPIPRPFVSALQGIFPMRHQMRLRSDKGLVTIARRESDFPKGELDYVTIPAVMRLLAKILEIYAFVQPLPGHRQPVEVV